MRKNNPAELPPSAACTICRINSSSWLTRWREVGRVRLGRLTATSATARLSSMSLQALSKAERLRSRVARTGPERRHRHRGYRRPTARDRPKVRDGEGPASGAIIRAMQHGAGALLFDQTLSPAQVNALAEYADLKVLDRTQVILDIFAQRAQTAKERTRSSLRNCATCCPGSAQSKRRARFRG